MRLSGGKAALAWAVHVAGIALTSMVIDRTRRLDKLCGRGPRHHRLGRWRGPITLGRPDRLSARGPVICPRPIHEAAAVRNIPLILITPLDHAGHKEIRNAVTAVQRYSKGGGRAKTVLQVAGSSRVATRPSEQLAVVQEISRI